MLAIMNPRRSGKKHVATSERNSKFPYKDDKTLIMPQALFVRGELSFYANECRSPLRPEKMDKQIMQSF
jgi:hypothetical protein